MRYRLTIYLWIAWAVWFTGCGREPFKDAKHSAQTENEMYVEGRTWLERDDLRVHVKGVSFTSHQVANYAGWNEGGHIWYYDTWVNGTSKAGLNEIARHEVCHVAKGDNHMREWCECMTGYLTIYCAPEGS